MRRIERSVRFVAVAVGAGAVGDGVVGVGGGAGADWGGGKTWMCSGLFCWVDGLHTVLLYMGGVKVGEANLLSNDGDASNP